MRVTLIRAKDEKGAAAVEFALVALLLVSILVGIVQFGFTFFQYLEVVHSAREGVRWASLSDIDVGSVADDGTVRGRVSAAAPGLSPGLADGDIVVAVDGAAVDRIDHVVHQGDAVTVTVTYDSPIFMPLLGELFGGEFIPLESSATMRVE